MRTKKSKKAHNLTDSSELGLKETIHSHAVFFDKLIELIPTRFYLPGDGSEKPWFHGLSKSQQVLSKKASRENIKKARRDRLDPMKSSSTLDSLNRTLKERNPPKSDGSDQSVTYEELRSRLRKRIESLRGNRGGPRKDDSAREEAVQKRKRGDGTSADVAEEVEDTLTFGRVKTGDEAGSRKRKVSRAKELEAAERLEAARHDVDKGEIVREKHSWAAATSRAAGIKVHDDPKLIKKSLKKEKRQHEKSAGKWKERVENREKMKAEKQRARAENISGRIQQKRKRRIEKREKKLMRAGFEGRKEGFITTE